MILMNFNPARSSAGNFSVSLTAVFDKQQQLGLLQKKVLIGL